MDIYDLFIHSKNTLNMVFSIERNDGCMGNSFVILCNQVELTTINRKTNQGPSITNTREIKTRTNRWSHLKNKKYKKYFP